VLGGDTMKIRLLRLICLIAGVAFLAFGAGLIGGHIMQRAESPDAHVTQEATPSSQPQEPAGAPAASPQLETEKAPENEDMAAFPISYGALPEKESIETIAPVVEESFLPKQTLSAGQKEAAPQREKKYVVQVLSTPNRPDAAEARNKMITAGYPAGIFEVDLGEKGMWYRIYVGPYDTESEARAVQDSVSKIAGFASSFVKALE
jgi:cell division septation protein DedD